MGQLKDLSVERVDAVDRPATGRTWTIIKSEDANEAAEGELRKAAADAVTALIKDEVQFSEETVEVLRRLAELLELDAEFKSVDGAPAEAEETETEAETSSPNDFAAQIAEAVKTALPEALEELLEKELAEADDSEAVEASADEEAEAVTKSAPKSKQAEGEGKAPVVKKGEGLFENIIFGQ